MASVLLLCVHVQLPQNRKKNRTQAPPRRTAPAVAAPVLQQWRAYTMLLTDYQAIHTMLLVNTARRPRRRRWRRLCGALRELGKKAQTAQQGQLTQAQYSVFCILVCLLLVSKRKLPALHLFVGTDALIQFRQGLGLHFFLARNQRGRELALQIAPAIACTLDFRGQKNNTSSFIALNYFILFSPTKHDVNCGTTQQL